MLWKKDVLFCDISPTTYAISMQKEICKRHIQDLFSKEKIAREVSEERLPNVISSMQSNQVKRAPGVELSLQLNKVKNIDLSCRAINGILVHPGETFSFWRTVGKTTKKKGYLDGRVLVANEVRPGIGGGLCNLANTIHRMVLLSPLTVTEFHSHSDALAPDQGKRVPFSTGTSISYNNVDYRFKNTTDQNIQLCLWVNGEELFGELRSEQEFPWTYDLKEEDHHFRKEGGKYYRISKIYKQTFDSKTGELLKKELILDNHSEVKFDYSLIPAELIRDN